MSSRICQCPPDRTVEALNVLFANLNDDARREMIDSLIGDAEFASAEPVGGLFLAMSDGNIAGCTLAQLLPGKSAVLWHPDPIAISHDIGAQLIIAADEFFQSCEISMAQAVLPSRDEPVVPLLTQAGFHRLTALEYLVASATPLQGESWPRNLRCEPFCTSQHQRLTSIVDATYRQTLDCPQLNGVRHMDDVIDGYRATGTHDPDGWFLVRSDGDDVGALLLTEHPSSGPWEILYMGIAPSARGRGLGKLLTMFALDFAAKRRASDVVLAVDIRNVPARRCYRQCGFARWDYREIFWKAY